MRLALVRGKVKYGKSDYIQDLNVCIVQTYIVGACAMLPN